MEVCWGPGSGSLEVFLGLRGKAGGCARVTAGPKRPHLGVSPAEGEGNEGFPPPPDKDLESPPFSSSSEAPLGHSSGQAL